MYPFFGEGERLSIAMNWNVQFSDEYMLSASEEVFENNIMKILNRSWIKKFLQKQKRMDFGKNKLQV